MTSSSYHHHHQQSLTENKSNSISTLRFLDCKREKEKIETYQDLGRDLRRLWIVRQVISIKQTFLFSSFSHFADSCRAPRHCHELMSDLHNIIYISYLAINYIGSSVENNGIEGPFFLLLLFSSLFFFSNTCNRLSTCFYKRG